jgi:hypothetical protein
MHPGLSQRCCNVDECVPTRTKSAKWFDTSHVPRCQMVRYQSTICKQTTIPLHNTDCVSIFLSYLLHPFFADISQCCTFVCVSLTVKMRLIYVYELDQFTHIRLIYVYEFGLAQSIPRTQFPTSQAQTHAITCHPLSASIFAILKAAP